MLGPEDCGPADRWLSLIGEALNESSSPSHERPFSKPRVSFSDLLSLEDEKFLNFASNKNSKQHNYFCLAASKQMVGVFLCVWVRDDLIRHISSLKVSCVGRGIMGYLGNKVKLNKFNFRNRNRDISYSVISGIFIIYWCSSCVGIDSY